MKRNCASSWACERGERIILWKCQDAAAKKKERRGEKAAQLSPYLQWLTLQNIFSPAFSLYLQRLTLHTIFPPGFVVAPLFKMPHFLWLLFWEVNPYDECACLFMCVLFWGGPLALFQPNTYKPQTQGLTLLSICKELANIVQIPFLFLCRRRVNELSKCKWGEPHRNVNRCKWKCKC